MTTARRGTAQTLQAGSKFDRLEYRLRLAAELKDSVRAAKMDPDTQAKCLELLGRFVREQNRRERILILNAIVAIESKALSLTPSEVLVSSEMAPRLP